MNPVASRYAQALFEWSSDKDTLNAVNDDLNELKKLIQNNHEFKQFLANPILLSSEKIKCIHEMFQSNFHEDTLTYLSFLIKKQRLSLLLEMCNYFNELYKKSQNILTVKLVSNLAFDDEQISNLTGVLEKRYSKTIDLVRQVDTKLMGGYKLTIDGYVYDSSIVTQLEKFKNIIVHA